MKLLATARTPKPDFSAKPPSLGLRSVMGDASKSVPRISLIIPTYNRCRSLRTTIPYYLAQEGIEEIIIVDDASLDNTKSYVGALLQQHPKIRYVRHFTRRGPPAARNTGIDHLSNSSQYVLFGEDDVIFEKKYSAGLLDRLEALGCDIVGGRLLPIRTGESFEECSRRYDEQLTRMKGHGQYPTLIDQRRLLGNYTLTISEPVLFLHACSLFRRRVFESVRFDENYRGNYFREETDVYLAARMKGFQISFEGDYVCFHMESSEGGVSDYGPLRSKLSAILHRAGFPAVIYTVLNNNYFLDKYYNYLKKELRYTRKKNYYKRCFALSLLSITLRNVTAGLAHRLLNPVMSHRQDTLRQLDRREGPF